MLIRRPRRRTLWYLLELDHVLIAVPSLDDGAERLARRHGLASTAGGRHPGWGTANRIVPLGGAYLELVAVVDPGEAAASAFGRWVAAASPGPFGWAVRTRDIDSVANRLGLTVTEGSRVLPDGDTLRWRSAGVERAAAEPMLPFFIAWDGAHPGTARDRHPAGAIELVGLELGGEANRLADWLGGASLPIVVVDGPAGLARVELRAGARRITLEAERGAH